MKHRKIILSTVAALALLASCSNSDRASYEESMSKDMPMSTEAAAPQASPGYAADGATSEMYANSDGGASINRKAMSDSISGNMSSSAASTKGGPFSDTTQQFIRTAEARFRVENVRDASFAIEKITAHFDGYVAHTGLESTIDNEKRTPVSDDSTLITTYFTVSNSLTLRVPVDNLDSALRALGKLAVYMDYRRIHVENATLMILRERLEARRIAHTTARLEDAVDDGNAKLRDRAAVEEALYNKQTAADESYLRTLELRDQIKLSTINLSIYQRQAWVQEMVANEKPVEAYKPGFVSQMGKALGTGWNILKGIILGLLSLWPLVLLVAGIVVTAIWLNRRSNRK